MKDSPWMKDWQRGTRADFACVGGPYRTDHMFKKHGKLPKMYKPGEQPIYYQARILKLT